MEPTSNSRYIEGVSLHVFMPDDSEKVHAHREIELLYNIEGSSVVKVEEASYRLEEDHVMLINAGKRHSIRKMTGSGTDIMCCIHISEKMLCDYVGRRRLLFWCNSTKDSTPGNYTELKKSINTLLVDYMSGKDERYFMRYSECYTLLHLLLTYFLVSENSGDNVRSKTDTMDERYDDILHFIDMNYNTELSLGELADEFSLSVSYLSRYLRKKL